MHIPITIAALVLLTAAMLLLRIFWTRLTPRLRVFLVRGAIAMAALHVFFVVTRWGTSLTYVNVIINWFAIAGYVLLVMLFSRISPRWLTSLSAAVLLAPLFTTSVLLPLTMIFQPGIIPAIPIGNNLYYKVAQWSNNGEGNSGVDLDVLYRPPFAPFLSRRVQSQPFNTQECNAYAASALLGPRPRTVIARCPHWPTQPVGAEDKLLQLR
ncbi:hypothetical protein [Granulicella sp. L60]|jgi:hypothetical protein|uniref:hypothetical protein n=1 Tax=Granulicella sp. L60 TaxID=1641866 RepID=UPI00131DD451|nr:hypothetical protein [Granulicella sp. L60]